MADATDNLGRGVDGLSLAALPADGTRRGRRQNRPVSEQQRGVTDQPSECFAARAGGGIAAA
jgi:hypothetical protein